MTEDSPKTRHRLAVDIVASSIDRPAAVESIKSWLNSVVGGALKEAFALGSDGLPAIRPEATTAQITTAAIRCYQMTAINEVSATVTKMMLGRLVLERAARESTGITSTIENMGLEDSTATAAATIAGWARAAQEFYGQHLEAPHVPMSFYVMAAQVAGPKEPAALAEFRAARTNLLAEAADSPQSWTGGRFYAALREVQRKTGGGSGEHGSAFASRPVLARRALYTAHYLQNASSDDLAAAGLDRATVESALADLLEQLTQKGYFDTTDYSDPATYPLPWTVSSWTSLDRVSERTKKRLATKQKRRTSRSKRTRINGGVDAQMLEEIPEAEVVTGEAEEA